MSSNPVIDIVTITASRTLDLSNVSIGLYDSLGRLLVHSIYDQVKDDITITLALLTYTTGMYFLKMNNSNGRTSVTKLFKI